MKISHILNSKRTISFEFYPPRTPTGIKDVFDAINILKEYNPDFISITSGAGGTTRALTEEIAVRAHTETDLNVVAHVTCVGQNRDDIDQILRRLENAGIENIVALRGDLPKGEDVFQAADGGFAHASGLIDYAKANFNFDIAGACYPESHVESSDIDSDIYYTKKKVESGADVLISQLFFDNTYFFEFVERARNKGVLVPIVAGLLPVLSASQIRRFTLLCGATIPKRLETLLTKYEKDDYAMREAGIEYASEQVDELLHNGVQGIHFYALNRNYSISRILDNLKL